MTENSFRSIHKVRSYECDQYGHVNHAHYIHFLEFARMEVLEKKGFTLGSLRAQGVLLVVYEINIKYKFPAQSNEELFIYTDFKAFRKISATFHQKIIRKNDQQLIAEADVTWVSVNEAGRPVAIPPAILHAFGIKQ